MTDHATLSRVLRWTLLLVFASGMVVQIALGGGLDRSAILIIALAAYVVVGLVVSSRQPGNPIGWLFLLVGALTGLSGWGDALMTTAVDAGTPDVWYGVLGAWIYAWFWFPLISIATLFTVLLFPDGLLSRRWRLLLWTSIVSVSLLTLAAALAPTLVVSPTGAGPTVANPLSPALDSEVLDDAVAGMALVALACGVLSVVEAVIRTRRAHGVERAQMQWFAFAAVVVVLWVAFGMVLWSQDSVAREIVFTLVIGLIPVSCGIAITRYHLYDIDRIISRTTSYAIVTGLVLATFFVVVAAASSVLGPTNQLGVAAATLAAAALARPALRRVQVVVDRRFNRSRYDAQQTAAEFGERLQQRFDSEEVLADLRSVVHVTLQPALTSVTLVRSL